MSWPNVVCCLGVVVAICATLVAIAALDLRSPNRRCDSPGEQAGHGGDGLREGP